MIRDRSAFERDSTNRDILAGPDLKNVSERRDRAWLIQFIQDPSRLEMQKLKRVFLSLKAHRITSYK